MILRFAPSTDSMKLDFDVNSNVNHPPVHCSPYYHILIFVADDVQSFCLCKKNYEYYDWIFVADTTATDNVQICVKRMTHIGWRGKTTFLAAWQLS